MAKTTSQIVLYERGDFFNAYGANAYEVSRILNLPMTTEADGQASVGIPRHRLVEWRQRLADVGHSVTIDSRTFA